MPIAHTVRSFQIDRLRVEIYDTEADIVNHLVEEIARYLQMVQASQGNAAAILASGGSQIALLEQLTNPGKIDWSHMTLFHLDEYLGIGREHPASFQRYMQELVTDRVHPQAFHYLLGDTLEPIAECDRYSRLLAAQNIDLCMLGIGETGHIAFNDPEVASFADPYAVKLVKLAEKSRQQQVNTGFFSHIQDVPQYALTLTIPSILRATQIRCLAMGNKKAPVVKQMLTGPITPQCPASVLRHHPGATLYLDTAAASLLATSGL
jgi:glucosamine-6-phosphate deaminase